MSPEEAEAIVPNGWKMLKLDQIIPKGEIMRMHKHLGTEWLPSNCSFIHSLNNAELSNYYAVSANVTRTEW